MPNLPHPDDELLAAYAGGDPDALADATLAAHLTACDRCRPLVEELSLLRGALAELPDLAPSRPLRLIPPVPAPPARGGSWLRRLTAPAMAAGAALVLVGAVGVGVSGGLSIFGQAASGAFQNAGDDLEGAAAGSQKEVAESDGAFAPQPGAAGSPMASSGETRGGVSDSSGRSQSPGAVGSPEVSPSPAFLNGEPQPEQPWLTLLIAGAGLFVISAALRFSISPRAG